MYEEQRIALYVTFDVGDRVIAARRRRRRLNLLAAAEIHAYRASSGFRVRKHPPEVRLGQSEKPSKSRRKFSL